MNESSALGSAQHAFVQSSKRPGILKEGTGGAYGSSWLKVLLEVQEVFLTFLVSPAPSCPSGT